MGPQNKTLFSVRMRASRRAFRAGNLLSAQHISGGERLVVSDDIRATVETLLSRALNHPNGQADTVKLTVEEVEPGQVQTIPALPIVTVGVETPAQGLALAHDCLESLGIAESFLERAFEWITQGAAPDGGNMRGAVIFDVATGRRVEPDPSRGVRATRVDYTPQAASELEQGLRLIGAYNPRTRDALALATKILSRTGVIAELCCSDDRDYLGGYVASRGYGYLRINLLKPPGHPLGARIIFVDSRHLDLPSYVEFLQSTPLQIDSIPSISAPITAAQVKLSAVKPPLVPTRTKKCVVSLQHRYPLWCLPAAYRDTLAQRWPGVSFSFVSDETEEIAHAEDCDFFFGWKVSPGFLAVAKNLKWVQLAASGIDKRLPPNFADSGVQLTTMTGAGARGAAEYVLGIILGVARGLFTSVEDNAQGKWDRGRILADAHHLKEASETRVVVLGLGSIGCEVARLLKATGFQVVGCARRMPAADVPLDAFVPFDQRREALAQADFLVVCLALNDQTRKILDAESLAVLPAHAYLVNVAREEIVDMPALEARLARGLLRGISIDVLAVEPPPQPRSPVPGVLVTPHIATATRGYWARAVRIFESHLASFLGSGQ